MAGTISTLPSAPNAANVLVVMMSSSGGGATLVEFSSTTAGQSATGVQSVAVSGCTDSQTGSNSQVGRHGRTWRRNYRSLHCIGGRAAPAASRW